MTPTYFVYSLPALAIVVACGSAGAVDSFDASAPPGDASVSGDGTSDVSAQTLDGMSIDASSNVPADAPDDSALPDSAAAYALCGSTIDPSLKGCGSDADCAIETHDTDCCGGILYVGIAQSSVSTFTRCENAWDAHFPACGCFSDAKKAEDGSCVGNACGPVDGAAPGTTPQVHCLGSGDARRCETSLP